MTEEEKIKNLIKAKEILLPRAKFWNQNNLFLSFGVGSVVMFTSGFELFKIIAKDYSFKFVNLIRFYNDYYFLGMLIFFVFGLIVVISTVNKIDGITKDTNLTLKTLDEEIQKLKT